MKNAPNLSLSFPKLAWENISHRFCCQQSQKKWQFECRNVKIKSRLEMWQLHRSVKQYEKSMLLSQRGHGMNALIPFDRHLHWWCTFDPNNRISRPGLDSDFLLHWIVQKVKISSFTEHLNFVKNLDGNQKDRIVSRKIGNFNRIDRGTTCRGIQHFEEL